MEENQNEKSYAVSLILIRQMENGTANIQNFLAVCRAKSKEEAIGQQFKAIQEQRPGFTIHSSPCVMELICECKNPENRIGYVKEEITENN